MASPAKRPRLSRRPGNVLLLFSRDARAENPWLGGRFSFGRLDLAENLPFPLSTENEAAMLLSQRTLEFHLEMRLTRDPSNLIMIGTNFFIFGRMRRGRPNTTRISRYVQDTIALSSVNSLDVM